MLSFFLLALLSRNAIGLDNGVARTPPMGWNPYNVFSCNTNEDQYHAAAQALVQSGLRDVGYKYFNMDCGWQATSRASGGLLTWDVTRIPSGIPALSQYVHGLGLMFGIHGDAGYFACDSSNGAERRIGNLGHENSDAKTLTQWQVDYLKYDSCFAFDSYHYTNYYPSIAIEGSFGAMREALHAYHDDMVYSICEWGVQDPARWAGAIGNTWRISNDISPSFESLRRIINQVVPITTFTRPGSFNDLDILEVGNTGLTQTEWAMHFAFWAAAKSPLIISTDLTTVSDEVLDILKNERIIAVNQDPLGESVDFMRRYTDSYDVWAGPLADGSKVAVLINWMRTPQTIRFDLSDVYLASADLTDLWTGTDLGTINGFTTADVDAHGALIYKLSNCVEAAPVRLTTYLAAAPTNILSGGATPRNLDDFTIVVGGVGYTGILTFVGVDGGSNGGTKTVSLSYVNADYTFVNTDCPNCRRVEVCVNDGDNVVVEIPLSGQSWDLLYHGYRVSLDGFLPGPNNKIEFANPIAWAPDFYSINVEV